MQRGRRIGINNVADGKRPGCGYDQKEPLDQGRRVRTRLQYALDCEKPSHGSGKKQPLGAPGDNVSKNKVEVEAFLKEGRKNLNRLCVKDENCSSEMRTGTPPIEHGEKEIVNSEDDDLRCTGYGNPLVDKYGIGTFLKLKEILRLLNLHYLQRAKEEKRGKNVEVSDLQIVNGSKFNISEQTEIFNADKKIDLLPGIEVGHQFLSRSQMSLAGFHEHWLGGIDCMRKSYSKLEEYHGYTFPIAATMLLSGQYEDDVDDLVEVVYTDQGGNDSLFNKRQVRDQVMRLGNLALKHNMDYNVPVGVIRRQDCAHSYTGKVYTYDGLYKVVKCWDDKDVSEFTVFKYHLKRLQPRSKLALKDQVRTIRGKVSKVLYALPGLVCMDISNGQEDICIPATNVIDNPAVAPSGFTYIKSVKVADNVILPQTDHGCKCKGNCNDRRSCSCAKRNGSDFPYVRRDGGRLIEAKDVVFECGPNCVCGPRCVNRTSQQGLKYQLEVYRTKDKGWAVRSLDFIPSGAPVCEYTGVLKKTETEELDSVSENDFIFEIDCLQTMNEIGVRERRGCNVSVPTSDVVVLTNDEESESAPEFCIDAGLYGNVARFINHSCEPNLFVQCVLSSHDDVRLARVVLFAADDIPPMQELTYDYGYQLDSVVGPDGKIKKMPCNCGTADCRKRLY
ncbi:hypothetical protein ACOSP7_031720 [Xanthoceras sorbifolium]